MGPIHAGLQVLLRQAPQLVIELLIHAQVLPAETADWVVHLRPTEGLVVRPVRKRREKRADLIFIVAVPGIRVANARARRRALRDGQAYSVIFELQRFVDESRPDTWADYWSAYRLDLSTDIRLVILTFDAAVAEWARVRTERIDRIMKILVLTAADCPHWSNAEGEHQAERAVLNALLHARDETHFELIRAAVSATEELDDELALHYDEMLIEQLGEALIQQAMTTTDPAISTMASQSSATDYENSPRPMIRLAVQAGQRKGRQEGIQEGRQEGIQEGRQEGIQEGMQAGIQRGELEARAKVVLEILDHRAVPSDPESRARVLACQDPQLLARWLIAALQVTSIAQLFEG